MLLASYVLEYVAVDPRLMLATCRRHVAPDGRVIFQRQPPEWYDTVRPGSWTRNGVEYQLGDLARLRDGTVSATMKYRIGEQMWSHSFTSRRLDDDALPGLLGAAGLRLQHFVTPDRGWVVAVPSSAHDRRPAG